MFLHESGRAFVEWYPKKASVAMVCGDLTYFDASGAILLADATSGDHAGVLQKDIASSDSDYASNTYVPVLVPTEQTVWRVDVGTGSFTTAMIGNQYDLKDENEIDVSAQSKNVVTIVGYVSSSVALVKINAMIAYGNVATT